MRNQRMVVLWRYTIIFEAPELKARFIIQLFFMLLIHQTLSRAVNNPNMLL